MITLTCAALFKYMREYAVKFREHSVFICDDDKHHIKVGEPLCLLLNVGARLSSLNQSLQIEDHYISRFPLILSVNLEVNISETIMVSIKAKSSKMQLLKHHLQFDMQLSSTRHFCRELAYLKSMLFHRWWTRPLP